MVLVVQAQHATYANQPIITKQDTFFIPFTAPNDTEQVSIVELYVSGDRGENWSLYQQRGPTEKPVQFPSWRRWRVLVFHSNRRRAWSTDFAKEASSSNESGGRSNTAEI